MKQVDLAVMMQSLWGVGALVVLAFGTTWQSFAVGTMMVLVSGFWLWAVVRSA